MSLRSTTDLRTELVAALGERETQYWDVFHDFIAGQISQHEFSETVQASLNTPHLVQLHNALIVSIFDTSRKKVLAKPVVDAPKKPPRKRRRLLPYQGPDEADAASLTSERLKKWTVGLGKRERERVQALEAGFGPPLEWPQPKQDEIARERGVVRLSERGEPAGSRLAVHLGSVNETIPSVQQLSERVNLICAQHNLQAPTRAVATFLMIAVEARLKELATRAIALTLASRAISSIRPSVASMHTLSVASFMTLFTVSPGTLPNDSAAAVRLAIGDSDPERVQTTERGPQDLDGLLQALRSQRSGYKDMAKTSRGLLG